MAKIVGSQKASALVQDEIQSDKYQNEMDELDKLMELGNQLNEKLDEPQEEGEDEFIIE